MNHSHSDKISGYTYGSPDLPKSPITLEDLEKLKQSVMFTPEDEVYLRKAGELLEEQLDDIMDLWYGFVGKYPFLVRYFGRLDGKPDEEYLAAVRRRFRQWVLDTCNRPYDQDWLNYQHEIALRHHRSKKNVTDGVQSIPNIDFRYLITFIYPITSTIKYFLAKKGRHADEVEKMHDAWFKSIVLQITLWSYPYVKEGDF